MNFEIDEQYITWVKHTETKNLTFIETGETKEVTFSSMIDHPEFTKLREQLGAEGYILIERSWWNGDRVLKPFTLNGWKFKEGNQFPCASALAVSIECAKKYGWKQLSIY
jgi:hypothetical protein